jgi:hypothetical protein
MPPPCNTIDLHAQWRTISSLTSLTAAINNEGHSTLGAELTEPYSPYRPSDDTNDQEHSRVLNAISTILVRKLEAVAAIACKPLPPANFTPMSEPNPYRIFVLENTEPVTCPQAGTDPDDAGGALTDEYKDLNCGEDSSNVAVMENLEADDPYFDNFTGSEECILLVKHAESHMPKILDKSNHWVRCLQIPCVFSSLPFPDLSFTEHLVK